MNITRLAIKTLTCMFSFAIALRPTAVYEAAVRTLVLCTPDDCYAGPFTYKRYWYRNAVFIAHGLLSAGLVHRARHLINRFPERQSATGYYHSQEGEWDANGEVIWLADRFQQMTGETLDAGLWKSLKAGADWIDRKRLPDYGDQPHEGLLPAGFSAEHLGRNDHYYWDNYWALAGLLSVARLASRQGEDALSSNYQQQAERMHAAIDRSLARLPAIPGMPAIPAEEPDVIRIPAVRHFNQTDFSVVLPIPRRLDDTVKQFKPDVVHSHHPFLVGGTALRVAHTHSLPLVFTHHTRYEDCTHNMPGDSLFLKRFVMNLASNYANLCDRVFVPSESVETMVRERGVRVPVSVVPTGVELDHFSSGNRVGFRKDHGIPENAHVVGHLGRLTEEKNIPFLIKSIMHFMSSESPEHSAHCLIVGLGQLERTIRSLFDSAGLSARLHMAGVIDETGLADAYHAMDVFASASTSETQGMVLTEAMASGLPVVAIDATGVREVLRDEENGYLLATTDVEKFSKALKTLCIADDAQQDRMSRNARRTAASFSMERTAELALQLYSDMSSKRPAARHDEYPVWTETLQMMGSEWELMKSAANSAIDALSSPSR